MFTYQIFHQHLCNKNNKITVKIVMHKKKEIKDIQLKFLALTSNKMSYFI